MSLDDIEAVLRERGHVAAVAVDHKRYVGAQIGVYNPKGEKVGAISHVWNREFLFLVGPSRDVVSAAIAATVNAG
jgi:adenine-specific DNA-methyltransferase